jgi:hypothetical protein
MLCIQMYLYKPGSKRASLSTSGEESSGDDVNWLQQQTNKVGKPGAKGHQLKQAKKRVHTRVHNHMHAHSHIHTLALPGQDFADRESHPALQACKHTATHPKSRIDKYTPFPYPFLYLHAHDTCLEKGGFLTSCVCGFGCLALTLCALFESYRSSGCQNSELSPHAHTC